MMLQIMWRHGAAKWQACFDLREEIPIDLPHDVAPLGISLFRMGATGAEAMVAEIAEMYQLQCVILEELSYSSERVQSVTPSELARLAPTRGRYVVIHRELESTAVRGFDSLGGAVHA